ncbi:hypothetical protein [Allofrancisella frigidaquae]|uniref:Uncharacterized protein n=1 Tax=Allofrancisella frigidaquae TaxID=1085644 RepID=A0A6M3HYA2_9GAMM|nr:hypothetical protein [Allofrancisella frigidaquae]QIV94636.1 hypothetical protein E3E15_04375 [Allofrancisella frigidaquae]
MYDRQVVISIDDTDDYKLLLEKWTYSHKPNCLNFDVIHWKGGNDFSNVDSLKKITANSRIYIVGHCMPGASVISKTQDLTGLSISYKDLGDFLVKHIPFHVGMSKVNHLTISLICCYAAVNSKYKHDSLLDVLNINDKIPSTGSFALKFITHLKNKNFYAKVLARSHACLVYNPYDVDTRDIVRDLGYKFPGNAGRKATKHDSKVYNSKDIRYKYVYYWDNDILKTKGIYGNDKKSHYRGDLEPAFNAGLIIKDVIKELERLSSITKTKAKQDVLAHASRLVTESETIHDVLWQLHQLTNNPVILETRNFWTSTSATEKALRLLIKTVKECM